MQYVGCCSLKFYFIWSWQTTGSSAHVPWVSLNVLIYTEQLPCVCIHVFCFSSPDSACFGLDNLSCGSLLRLLHHSCYRLCSHWWVTWPFEFMHFSYPFESCTICNVSKITGSLLDCLWLIGSVTGRLLLLFPPSDLLWSKHSNDFYSRILTKRKSVVLSGAVFIRYENVWPLVRIYRGGFLLIQFLFLLGINTYGWRQAGVNHVLIFEINPRNNLSHQHLFEVRMKKQREKVISPFIVMRKTDFL